MFAQLRLLLVALFKRVGDLYDFLKPKGYVTLILRYADGPKAGEVARVIKGRNVITGFLGESFKSGRDVIRLAVVHPDYDDGESLAGDTDYLVKYLRLGSGTRAELSGDTELQTAITGSLKELSSIEVSEDNTWITFVFDYGDTEVNATISEAGLESENGAFWARKTFTSFTKNNHFTLRVRWQLRV